MTPVLNPPLEEGGEGGCAAVASEEERKKEKAASTNGCKTTVGSKSDPNEQGHGQR